MIPMDTLLGLQSRKFAKDECWLPTKLGDFVFLDDNTFGPVLLQTPEMVQMRIAGGSTKTYSIGSFLSKNSRNISHGFGILIVFGLDYNLQAQVTSEIPDSLKNIISSALEKQPHCKFSKETIWSLKKLRHYR